MEHSEVASYWEANADAWTRHSRAGYDAYRDALNTPAFLAALPAIAGLKGIDIGCGEGTNTRQLARRGASMQAIDIAPTFIRHAQEAEEADPLGITFLTGDGMRLPFEAGEFDFATAFMSMMDMPDQATVFREVERVLRPGGFLQFSILHPCFVPPHRKVLRDGGQPRAVEVAGYFDRIDGRIDTFWFETLPTEQREIDQPFRIPRFHRTLSEWVEMIVVAGLAIERFVEPCASLEIAAAEPVVADTRIVPLSLVIRARKPT
ncbi:MAG TPA: class I SAM-dependent methyltransferase [Stellaceae bacterium]|nr:class I SAM-dependent methyltransferase [Stellaceae bacterium]